MLRYLIHCSPGVSRFQINPDLSMAKAILACYRSPVLNIKDTYIEALHKELITFYLHRI